MHVDKYADLSVYEGSDAACITAIQLLRLQVQQQLQATVKLR